MRVRFHHFSLSNQSHVDRKFVYLGQINFAKLSTKQTAQPNSGTQIKLINIVSCISIISAVK